MMLTFDRLTQTRNHIAQFAAISALAFTSLATQPAAAQSAYIGPSGSVSSPKNGSWNAAANWSPNGVPVSASTTSLSFGGSGTTGYTATDDISGAFTLNSLTFNSSSTITNTLTASLGNSLNFVTNGSTTPAVTQTGSGAFNLNIPLALTNSLTFNGTGAGKITSNGIFSGSGSLTQSDPNNTLTLGLSQTSTVTNTSKAVTVTSTNGLTVGEAVAGTGIVAGTTIASITDGTHFMLSTAATGNGTSVAFSNTYTGGTTITAGTLSTSIGTNATGGVSAFGTGAIALGDTTVGSSNNATLSFNGGNQHIFNAINVAAGSSGTLSLVGTGTTSNVNFDGLITLSNNLTIQESGPTTGGINVNSGGTGTAITGTGNVSIVNNSGTGTIQIKGGTNGFNNIGSITHTGTSSGTDTIQAGLSANVTSVTQNSSTSPLNLSGTNTSFTGALNVLAGKLSVSATTSSTSILATVNTGGTLDVSTYAITLAGVNDGTGGGGTVTNSGASVKTLTLGGSGTYSFSGILSGGANLALTKSGTGTQTLSGANTYAGTTTISGGELRLDNTTGSGTGSGVITLSGGALSGAGSETGKVTVTGSSVLAPGDNTSGNFGTAGTLGVGTTSGATLSDATLDFDLSSAFNGPNDLLTTGGTLSLGTLAFNFNELNGTLDTTAPYTLISGAGSVTGFSTAVFSTAFSSGATYTPTYSLSGNNLQVSFAPIAAAPEPSQGAALLIGAIGLGGLARKARRRTQAA